MIVYVIAVKGVGNHCIVERLSSNVRSKVLEAGGLSWWWPTWLGTWSGTKRTVICWGTHFHWVV